MQAPSHISVTITSGTILTVIAALIAVGILFYLKGLVLVVLTAIVIASAIEPPAHYLMRLRIPRIAAVLMVYATVVTALFALFYFFVPSLLREASNFLLALPEYLERFGAGSEIRQTLLEMPADDLTASTRVLVELSNTFTATSAGVATAVSTVFGGLISFVLILVLSFYFAVREEGIDDFLRLISPGRHREYVINLWRRSQYKIGRWMQGQLMLSLIIGVLVYLGLSILGVRYALLLAIIAALFELIPVFGSIIAAVPAVAIGFLDGGTSLALLVVLLYVIVNQFQGNLIYPLVVQKVVGVPPLLVILALLAGAQLGGFLGIILSVPAAAIIQEFVNDIHKRRATLNEIPARG